MSGQGFQSFDNVAADVVLALSYNASGTRFATTSADQRIRVYDVDSDDGPGQLRLVDQWRGHDAEIHDVQWIDSLQGEHLGTIGGDDKFKLWREDPLQSTASGRRFRCVFSQSPFHGVAYVAFEFLTRRGGIGGGGWGGGDTWLALLTQDGLLSVLEPTEPDSLSDWRELDQLYPFGKNAHRGTGTNSTNTPAGSGGSNTNSSSSSSSDPPRFSLSFQRSAGPSANAIRAGLDPSAISLAVAAGSCIKILQAVRPDDSATNTTTTPTPAAGASGVGLGWAAYQFQETLEVDLSPLLPATAPAAPAGAVPTIYDIAWSPGPMRPHDTIAIGCDDATVRIVEIRVVSPLPPSSSAGSHQQQQHQGPGGPKTGTGQLQSKTRALSSSSKSTSMASASASASAIAAAGKSPRRASGGASLLGPAGSAGGPGPGPALSGIGAGLAGMTRGSSAMTGGPGGRQQQQQQGQQRPGGGGLIPITYEWEQVASLAHGHDGVHHGGDPVRKVAWVYDGSMLASSSGNGKIHLWRQGLRGKYYAFSETGPA